jgi:hypothetical protein
MHRTCAANLGVKAWIFGKKTAIRHGQHVRLPTKAWQVLGKLQGPLHPGTAGGWIKVGNTQNPPNRARLRKPIQNSLVLMV